MVRIGTGADTGAREKVCLRVEKTGLDLKTAKEFAKRKAREICTESMLLSWNNAEIGEYYPRTECGCGDRPPWVVYADARGADLIIDVNDGQYTFMFLKLVN